MPVPAVALPEISISPPPHQEPAREPYSPFSPSYPEHLKEPDSPRPSLLSPPPTASFHLHRQLSPLRPDDAPVTGQGLERERFEALLRASRERNAAVGAKKALDLRKEIAVKVHKGKQLERRALFLAKLQAPPSPTATMVPKTPPESPAVFHYSLPSPGLESPLEVFELLALETPDEHAHVWAEQVDFRLPEHEYAKRISTKRAVPVKKGMLPSLDQITARLNNGLSQGPVAHETVAAPLSPRLPAFLRGAKKSEKVEAPTPAPSAVRSRRPLPAVGRLQFPSKPRVEETSQTQTVVAPPVPRLPPASPSSPVALKLQITTTVVPCMSSRSPNALTEANLTAFLAESRERTAKDMLSRLRRRTFTPAQAAHAAQMMSGLRATDEEKKLRRHSAPPELQLKERSGFCTPVLDIPGAF
ncbi:hypothetical protein EIP91_000635 [Steccherinum ochraceum]|uniref:Uncharacterized protein n=1 Tax=Steccherinum ochraceum TaxID=92696 RepID=A0A4R0RLZ1_9APHY|nr:hypothetical protein EIP91_000635 [Steccherinum ochraceum]